MLDFKKIVSNKFLPLITLFVFVFIIFRPFILNYRVPIPADTIVGLYHPYRDFFAGNFPRGIPFKNYLITDPVRQQYPWRWLTAETFKNLKLPLWNPYSLSGTPLLANFQSAVFYPLNLLFALLPFTLSWSLLVILQPLLASTFFYLYIRNLKVNISGSVLASAVFTFSGFAVSWLEWNTIVHTGLWLPLILLSIDKLILNSNSKEFDKRKSYLNWSLIYLISLLTSFFAGHLQTFFYLYVFQTLYFALRLFKYGLHKSIIFRFLILNLFFLIISAIQWYPTLQLLGYSARNVDLDWTKPGWFIPWQHLIQFIIPDFFGNPTTLNYWGEWNYGEFVGYVGIVPFMLALIAIFHRYDKKTFLYGSLFFITLLFSLPTIIAKIPYLLNIPFLATAQPTRLLFITDFSLAVLAGIGLDYVMKTKKTLYLVQLFFLLIFIGVGYFILSAGANIFSISAENIAVVKRNTIIPFVLFVLSGVTILSRKYLFQKLSYFPILFLIVLTFVDLGRFTSKYLPFTDPNYLYPNTKVLSFLQDNIGNNRIMSLDPRILPPNFSVMYKLQSIEGYDPIYLLSYGELITAFERNKPDIKPPFGFNRIVTVKNYNSELVNLMGVKYILSLNEITDDNLNKVFQEGQTIVYENKSAFPRAFLVKETKLFSNKEDTIKYLINNKANLKNNATVEIQKYENLNFSEINLNRKWAAGSAKIDNYSANEIVISTEVTAKNNLGFLILTDSYYPTWKVKIQTENSNETKEALIFKTDYNFRGVIVPSGKSKVIFYNTIY